MDKAQRKKYLFKNTIIFTLGNIGTRVIMFFLVPLYTNFLTTSEYGIVDLITTIITIVTPIITLNISEGIMRFSLDKGANNHDIVDIGLLTMIFSAIIGVLIVPICSIFNIVSEYAWLIYLYAISCGLSITFLYTLRGKELLIKYSIGCIIQALCIAGLNILFLTKFNWGIRGYISAYTIAYFVTAIFAFFAGDVWKAIPKFHIDKKLAKEMMIYSIVLVPNSFMWWIMNSSDRIMVTSIVNTSANGIYAIASKIPTVISSLSAIFIQAWNYSAIKEKDSEDKDEYNNYIFNNLVKVMIVMAILVNTFIRIFLRIFVNKDFYSAWEYVPPLMVGVVFLTMASFLSSAYTVHKDSWGFLKSGTIGAIINIGLNFLMIPRLGALGAAIATCISYLLVLLYRIKDTKKYIKISIFNKQNILGILLLLISSILVYINNIIMSTSLLCFMLAVVIILYRNNIMSLLNGIVKKK